jgi:membrane-associated phospholipid phosphatase
VRAFLHAAEATTLDAFPSGHTAVSLVAAAVAPKATRVARLAWWGWGASIVFATVYIHVHYVADVIAGLLLALAVLWLTGLGGAPGRASDAPRTL